MTQKEIEQAKKQLEKATIQGLAKRIPKVSKPKKKQMSRSEHIKLFRFSQCGKKIEPYLREYYRFRMPNRFEVKFTTKYLKKQICASFDSKEEAVVFRDRFLRYFVNWTETADDPEGLFRDWKDSITPDNPPYKRLFQKIYKCVPELKN